MNNFNKVTDRRNTNSYKWDVQDNELPMWVADMDLQTSPDIIKALHDRVDHGIFGYNYVPKEWNESIINWWSRRHNFKIDKDWLLFCTGVVPAISSVVRKITTPGENVVIMTPVYNIFFNSILNNGRNALESKLEYKNNKYYIDFNKLEEDLKNPQTSLLLLCNPHNPIGKIWDKETLSKIGDLCLKHNVVVLSDEIHCDITTPGHKYTPFASVSDACKYNSITCISPSKAFNMAGLKSAAISVPNPNLRHKVFRTINNDEVAEPNSFAITAVVTAYEKGEKWLTELLTHIDNNITHVKSYITKELPQLKVVSENATYLLWIDCSSITDDTKQLANFIRKNTGLYLSNGQQFGGNGNLFLRMNIACSKQVLEDGLNRLKEGISKYANN